MLNATARVIGMAIQMLSSTLSRNQAMMKAMRVEMVISTHNSTLSDENEPIGRSVSKALTERPGFESVVCIPPNTSASLLRLRRFERVSDAMHGPDGLRTQLMS